MKLSKRERLKRKKKKKLEEEEEEPVKYSTIMWIAIMILFFGIVLLAIGLWTGRGTFSILGVVLVAVGVPLLFMEYKKMEFSGKRQVKHSALLLVRDVIIAFLIVGIIMGSIIAYSQTDPPMVVIESDSMQHSNDSSFIGTIDTGDMVLVRKAAARSDIITYVEGRASGYQTYGDYGDVIIFRKWGAPTETETPIIHRPLIYLEWNHTTNSSFDAPSLTNLELNKDWGCMDSGVVNCTSPYDLAGILWIRDVGYMYRNVSLNLGLHLSSLMNSSSPPDIYLTAGDHNLGRGALNVDPWYVKQEWVVGVARGELPWFGLIKLTMGPEASGCCQFWGDPSAPKNSWDMLLISIVLIIIVPFLLDFAIGYLLDRRKKRKKKEKRLRDIEAPPPPPSPVPPPPPEPSLQSETPPIPPPSPPPHEVEPSEPVVKEVSVKEEEQDAVVKEISLREEEEGAVKISCPSCGKLNDMTRKKCSSCGEPLGSQ